MSFRPFHQKHGDVCDYRHYQHGDYQGFDQVWNDNCDYSQHDHQNDCRSKYCQSQL